MKITTVVCVVALALGAGCGESGSGAGDGSPPSNGSAAVDWDSVEPVEGEQLVNAWSQLSRYVDAWHRGARERVTLFCDAHGRVTDESGNAGEITLAEWKACLDSARGSPDARTAVRAMPAAAYDHKDQLGEVPRFAYYMQEGDPEGSLGFILIKPLSDASGG